MYLLMFVTECGINFSCFGSLGILMYRINGLANITAGVIFNEQLRGPVMSFHGEIIQQNM